MKKLTILLILALTASSLLFNSCNDGNNCLTGMVRFTNTSVNPYDLCIDGTFEIRINGDSFVDIDLLEGQYNARIEQVEGFILVPTITERELNVFNCQNSHWVFP